MSEQFRLVAKVDGSGNGARGSAAAAVLFDIDGIVIKEKAIVWGRGTNNIAEYRAVLLAIEVACALEADELEVLSDSQLVVNQLQENWDCKDKALQRIRQEVWDFAFDLDFIEIRWIPREENKRSDHLCRVAMKSISPEMSEFGDPPPAKR